MNTALQVVLAHGVGSGRADLPLPVWLFTYAAGMAVAISFVAAGIFWSRPRLPLGPPDPPLTPPPARGWLRMVRGTGRVVGVALFALTVATALAGPANGNNLSLVLVFVVFWVGLPLLSAVVGDVWQVLSPWDTAALVARRLRGRGADPVVSAASGHWLAAAGLAAFVWLELCYHSPSSPRVLGWLTVGYACAMVAGAAWRGRGWLRTGDAFAAWFGLLAAIAPLHRDAAGRVRLRLPFVGLASTTIRSGTVALVVVALGSTAFDSFARSDFWLRVLGDREGWALTGVQTLGLAWVVGVVGIAYAGALRLNARMVGIDDPDELLGRFVHSLVPIALAYVIAHYFSLLVFESQQVPILMSDPLARGWDLFGTIDWNVNYLLVSTRTISLVQVGAIVAGHVAGVLLAHDRAVALFPPRQATRAQLPLVAVMVLYTVGGLLLLLGS